MVEPCILECSDDSGCDHGQNAGPNCNVNTGKCFFCTNRQDCMDMGHGNKICENGGTGRCIEGKSRDI